MHLIISTKLVLIGVVLSFIQLAKQANIQADIQANIKADIQVTDICLQD